MICYKITTNNSHSFYDKKLKYKVGETYECDGSPIPHENGFHVCKNVLDLLYFGSFIKDDSYTSYVVDVCGDYVEYDDKFIVTNKLKVLKLLTFDDVCKMYNVTSDLIHDIVFGVSTIISSYVNIDNELIQSAIACCQFGEDLLFNMAKSKYDIVRFLLISRCKPRYIQNKLLVLLMNDSYVATVTMIIQCIDEMVRTPLPEAFLIEYVNLLGHFVLETYERFKNNRMIKINMARSQFCRSLLYDKLVNDDICKVRCIVKYPLIFGGNVEEFDWSDKE